jgi:hypothetical protein
MTQASMAAALVGVDAVKPFRVHFSDEMLSDLKRRVGSTRWPDREVVPDQSQGVQRATAQKLARYWIVPELFTTELRTAFRSLRVKESGTEAK